MNAKKPNVKKPDSFPFNLPLVKAFEEINFQKPVTFFVGENGSGKSTMLEAIAVGINDRAAGEKN